MQAQRKALCGPALLAGLLAVFAVSPVWAQLQDPSTLHIGPGAGTICAQGCMGDPNLIGAPGNVVDVFQQSGGVTATLTQPLLLIIGIPNDTTALFATNPIASVTFINPYPNSGSSIITTGSGNFATSGTFGVGTLTNGFAGFETSSDVYTFLGLGSQVNNSNSVGNLADCGTSNGKNWTCTDLSRLGISAAGFGIYVFALTGANLGPNGLVNVTFPGGLGAGTFVVAYGVNTAGTHAYAVPFTEAGFVVPEPASLALFGSGVIALALAVRRRFRAS